jgi:hypothetical protein
MNLPAMAAWANTVLPMANTLEVLQAGHTIRDRVHSRLLNPGNPVNTSLLSIGVDVIHHRLDVGESHAIRNGSSVLIERTLPAGIEVDIDETMFLQARGLERVGLRDHVRLRQEVTLDGLLAETAPAEIWFLSGVIDLSACAGQESDKCCNYSEKGEIPGSHNQRPP